MVGDIYYTLRKTDSGFEMRKWEEGRSYPLDIYHMQIDRARIEGQPYSFQYCECPSRANPCKHWGIASDLLVMSGGWQELHHFYYQDGKVLPAEDL